MAKETRISQSERYEAKLSKDGFLGLNETDERINIGYNESKILKNIDSFGTHIEGMRGNVVLGRTDLSNEKLPLDNEEILGYGSTGSIIDSINWEINESEYNFVALSSGFIAYQKLDKNAGKHPFKNVQFNFDYGWTNSTKNESFDVEIKDLFSGKFIQSDMNELIFVSNSVNITIGFEKGQFSARLTGIPSPDFIQNSYRAKDTSTGFEAGYERIYGIELVECAIGEDGNFIYDESNYTSNGGNQYNLPIRIRSSGIQRYCKTKGFLETPTSIESGPISLTYTGDTVDLHRSNRPNPELLMPIWETMGFENPNIVLPDGIEYANLHKWTHVIIWRSKALKTWGNVDTIEGSTDELYPVASYFFGEVIHARQEIINHPKDYHFVTLGRDNLQSYTNEAVLTVTAFPDESYVPDLTQLALNEEMELQPIPNGHTIEKANKRLWTPKSNENRFDSTLFYSFSSVDYNGVYFEQIDVTRFISCNQGQAGSITGLVNWNNDLLVFKEGETGYIQSARTQNGYYSADKRIGICSPNIVKMIPKLGIVAITSDQNRFAIWNGSSWNFSLLNGYKSSRVIQNRLKNIVTSDRSALWGKKWVSFDYVDGFLTLAYIPLEPEINGNKPLTILRMNVEYGNGWTEQTLDIPSDTRHSTVVVSSFNYGNEISISINNLPTILWNFENGKNYNPTKRQIQSFLDDGNTNYYNHSQNPITLEFEPIKCTFDTSFYNSNDGRDLIEFKYFSVMAGLHGPITIQTFLNNNPWSYLVQPKIEAGFNDDYDYSYPKEYGFYIGLDQTNKKPVGQNFHFEMQTYSPFNLKSLDLFCFITTNPQNDRYDPNKVLEVQNQTTPPQVLAKGMEIWTTRDNMQKNNGDGQKVALYRPFIQAGSVNRNRE